MHCRSLEREATALAKVPSSKQIQAVPPAPEEIVEKDGVTYVKTPDGKLVVQEDRAAGQVTVSHIQSLYSFNQYLSQYLSKVQPMELIRLCASISICFRTAGQNVAS